MASERPLAGATRRITELLADARRGDGEATEGLVPLLYGELRRIAAALMARERRGATLQPTALVHEAYVRLIGGGAEDWQSRAHFLGAAARAMRRILVEHARKRSRLKRGGACQRVTLGEDALREEPRPEVLMALDAALGRLQAHDGTMARVVELRYFGGLTVEETAHVLDCSERSVHRSWAAARAWLHRELSAGPAEGGGSGAGGA